VPTFIILYFLLFAILFVIIVVASVVSDTRRKKRLAASFVVTPGVDYPNNFHVLGVGYYHAASRRWFPYAWNEFRAGSGYYWDGKWNETPDQRMVPNSSPPTEEVERVNQAWRDADPDQTKRFWEVVEREGFGTAIRRSEGS
jgi:hypothetical protein